MGAGTTISWRRLVDTCVPCLRAIGIILGNSEMNAQDIIESRTRREIALKPEYRTRLTADETKPDEAEA